jgi:hypothetical protein
MEPLDQIITTQTSNHPKILSKKPLSGLFLCSVYELFEFFGLANNIRARRKIGQGWERMGPTIGFSQLGMVFLHLCFTTLEYWREEDFFSQV